MQIAYDSWEFVKRHRGKIATASSVLGGVYAAKKVLESEQLAPYLFGQPRNPFSSGPDESPNSATLLQSRKSFIFDCHQQSGDKQVEETVQDVFNLVEQRFDTDPLIARLKTEPGLSTADKLVLWDEIKAALYGKCVAVKAERITHNQCAQEFEKLLSCFRKNLKRF